MSETAPINDEERTQTNELSHRRIFFWLCAILLINAVISAAVESNQFAAGVLIGGLGSVLNYIWLKWSFSAMFAKAVKGEQRKFLATRYFLRYVFFGAVLVGIYLTGIVPVTAVILGLASFALAVVAEGIYTSFVRERV